MEKQEIFKKLGRTIKAPTNICFTITDQVMYINLKVKEKCNNMQEDNSSFEAWMLCIMSKFHTEIDKVVLNWDECEQKDGHYNRFMYRVMKSCEYFNWFCVSDSKKQVLSEFRAQFESAFLVLNFPASI